MPKCDHETAIKTSAETADNPSQPFDLLDTGYRLETTNLEFIARSEIYSTREAELRAETARLERLARDEISVIRAAEVRTLLSNKQHIYINPTEIYQRHLERANVSKEIIFRPVTFQYQALGQPTKSSLKPATSEQSTKQAIKKQVNMQDNVTVWQPSDYDKTQIPKKSENWQEISKYSSVRFMVMSDLKRIYGKDAANPDGWMSQIEKYQFLDDININVKDTYQKIHDEEASERAKLESDFNIEKAGKDKWWTSLNHLVWY